MSGVSRYLKETTQVPAGDTEAGYFSPAQIVDVGDGRTVCWNDALPTESATRRITRWVTVHNAPETVEDTVG